MASDRMVLLVEFVTEIERVQNSVSCELVALQFGTP